MERVRDKSSVDNSAKAQHFQKTGIDLSSLSRRITLGYSSILGSYDGEVSRLVVEVIKEFSDKKVISLDVNRILSEHKIRYVHKDGTDDLKSIIVRSISENNLVILHGYDKCLLPHFSILFDDLGRSDYKLAGAKPTLRDIKTPEKLEATESFLLVVWTAEQKREYLDNWPGSASTREFTFVQESIILV